MAGSATSPTGRSIPTNCHRSVGIIFDGDDTLWWSERLYDDARSRARHIVEKSGLDGAEWERRERVLDVQNVARFWFSLQRFPTSCVEAYGELCKVKGQRIDASVAEQIRNTAESAFTGEARIVAGAKTVLTRLRSRGVRLALLTKGDPELQARRIEQSGLAKFFHVIRIVPEKSPDVIREVVAALGVDTRCAWMVGNSMRSDILPAVEAGVRAVRIPAHVWEHERTHDYISSEGVTVISSLAQIPKLIAR
ncbi:MAG TPA: HAD family hydrolase [Chthoniobacterales bacterium]|jgi:putative hydrolase of the HAD superfamily|nr:HAD family hydrolase [Chthoniobacterales bacterium]